YRFDAQAGDQFAFTVQSLVGARFASWRLVGPYGNDVFRTSFANVPTLTLPQAGTFTLLGEGALTDTRSGAYTFTLPPLGHVALPPVTGTPLVLGTTVSGTITTSGEQVVYLFSLPQRTLAYFDTLTNRSDMFWTLQGPAGPVVTDQRFDVSETVTNPVLNL